MARKTFCAAERILKNVLLCVHFTCVQAQRKKFEDQFGCHPNDNFRVRMNKFAGWRKNLCFLLKKIKP